jgi:hypothetical protein
MPEWESADTVPIDCDLEAAVLTPHGVHALVFPTRRVPGGWINAETKERVAVSPTHWRKWRASSQYLMAKRLSNSA